MTTTALPEKLTDKEMAVVRLLADGLTDEKVGERLGITRDTVKTYLRRINRRWGTGTRTQIVAVAYRFGLLPVHTATVDITLLEAAEKVSGALAELDPLNTTKDPDWPVLPPVVMERLGKALFAGDQLQAVVRVHLAGGDGRG